MFFTCAVYGWRSDRCDEEILEKLLALNLERTVSKMIASQVVAVGN